LPSRDQHMEMRLLLGLVHGARVMKGIGDWQCVHPALYLCSSHALSPPRTVEKNKLKE
jgi:hypothetical protein